MNKLIPILIAGLLFTSLTGLSQYTTIYPDLPKIDVHSHAHDIIYPQKPSQKTARKPTFSLSPNYTTINIFLEMREQLIKNNMLDFAMRINLGGDLGIDTVNVVSKGRMMTCIRDYVIKRGLNYKTVEQIPL